MFVTLFKKQLIRPKLNKFASCAKNKVNNSGKQFIFLNTFIGLT